MSPASEPNRPPHPSPSRQRPRSLRAQLSLEAILDASISTLDKQGIEGLTLRGLASSLGSGVASLYWYASSKEALMGMVADEILGRALGSFERLASEGALAPERFENVKPLERDERTSGETAAGLQRLRLLMLCLLEQMLEHRWLAQQLMNSDPASENALRFWDLAGQQLQPAGLSTSQQFHASLTVINYANGMGVEITMRQSNWRHEGEAHSSSSGLADTEAQVKAQIAEWEHLGASSLPFVRSMMGEFTRHRDEDQFLQGLHLILAGIERQSW